MDVKCERCSTEYEFDDALVSGRGTTVKCTNCGHKFKIRRSDGDFSEDFWNVTTGDGRTLVFTSLRELQRAIQGYLVERNDRLSRGGLPPKAIGHIPELAPFFEQREAAKRGRNDGRQKTQDGLGPAGALSPPSSGKPRQATTPEFPAPPSDGSAPGVGKSTLIGTGPVTPDEAFPVPGFPAEAVANPVPPAPVTPMPVTPLPMTPVPYTPSPVPVAVSMKSSPPRTAPEAAVAPVSSPAPIASTPTLVERAPAPVSSSEAIGAAPATAPSPVAAAPAPDAVPPSARSLPIGSGAARLSATNLPFAPAPRSEPAITTPRSEPALATPRSEPTITTPRSEPTITAARGASTPPPVPVRVSAPPVPSRPAGNASQTLESAAVVPSRPPVSAPPVSKPPVPPPSRPVVSRPPASEPRPPASQPLPPPTEPVAEAFSDSHVVSSEPPRARRSLLSELEDGPVYDEDDDDLPPPPRRRSVGAFAVTLVLLGCLGVLGVLWAQKNLGLTLGAKPPAAPAIDPRVVTFLASGDKALADGNIELAKESFDKASALAEKDPRVLLGLARLAAVRADVFWLKLRLLPADAVDEQRFTRESLGEQLVVAKKTADEALAVAPNDAAALRAKIDVSRLAGDAATARTFVSKVGGIAMQPETAYVLAALDLAEPEPSWSSIADRLRNAAAVETGPGRARAALVYALVRSGDTAAAKTELERLAAFPKPHPLLGPLRAAVERSKSVKLDAGVDASVTIAEVVDAGKHGKETKPGVTVASAPAGMPGDPRELVMQGERARAKGDYDRARSLFGAAVEKNPNDSEALAGLAAIAHAQRDLPGARAAYKRVLAINPNYMPALVGLADVDWESGDKASAMRAYKEISDRFPEGAYPARVKQRLEGGG